MLEKDTFEKYFYDHKFFMHRETSEEIQYFKEVFCIDSQTDCVLVRQGGKVLGFPLEKMRKIKERNKTFNLFWDDDLYFSPDTYAPIRSEKTDKIKYSAADRNMIRRIVWGIDIDYKRNNNSNVEPLDYFYNYLLPYAPNLPRPNWIEYGHQLRLIYILDESIYRKYGKQLEKGLAVVMQVLCQYLNENLDCCAEPQKAWYRVPGSTNSKDGSIVKVRKFADEKYTVQELLTEFLPELPMPREEYLRLRAKEGKRGVKRRIKCGIRNTEHLHKTRILDYYKLREYRKIPRELLVFCFGTAFKQLHPDYDQERIIKELHDFNRGFPHPLSAKEINSKFRTLGEYKLSNQKIRDMLGLTKATCKQLKLSFGNSKKAIAQRKREAEGRTHKQRRARTYKAIRDLYVAGVHREEIVKKTGYSFRTVTNYITEIRKDLAMNALETVDKLLAKGSEALNKLISAAENAADAIKELVAPLHIALQIAPRIRIDIPMDKLTYLKGVLSNLLVQKNALTACL